jgi:hypothetical protein
MHSKDRGPGIRTLKGQLLFSMLYFAGTDESLNTGWDQDPVVFNLGRLLQPRWRTLPDPPVVPPKGPAIDVIFNIGGGRSGSTP